MMEVRYGEVSLAACRTLLVNHHYLGRVPTAVQLCYGVWSVDPYEVVGCVVFSSLTGRLVLPEAWELTRLVKVPGVDLTLTRLVGKAVGSLRNRSDVSLLVSFADAEEGHHGGIYQACSWVYDGMREERLDGFNIDGQFIAARACNSTYGTSSVDGLRRVLKGRRVEPHYDCGKHCYWKALSKVGMQRAVEVGLRSTYYPKPMIEGSAIPTTGQRKGKVALPRLLNGQLPSSTSLIGGEDVLEE